MVLPDDPGFPHDNPDDAGRGSLTGRVPLDGSALDIGGGIMHVQ